jgi:hypothetical protein
MKTPGGGADDELWGGEESLQRNLFAALSSHAIDASVSLYAIAKDSSH